MSRPLAVWWVKRDARLADNACLEAAHQRQLDVLPFFCFEPSLMAAEDSSDMHVHAQWQAVAGLRTTLRERGLEILIAHGEVVAKLAKLYAAIPFSHLMSHEEIGNDLTFRRDRAVAQWCREHGVKYEEYPQSSVRRGGINRDRLQQQWQSRIVDPVPFEVPPIHQPKHAQQVASATGFPRLAAFAPHETWQPVSESEAHQTLADFLLRRGQRYRGGISSPNTAFSAGSRLSVHLAWGTISVRQIWHAVNQRIKALDPQDPQSVRWKLSLQAFLSRLHWRDHFTQRLESEPELEFRSLHPSYRTLAYENDATLLAAWQTGQTGYPMVDAVMRCLAETGFVNFRMRAMVTSFACHVLHLDWRWIHPHLASVFRDYDPGIHLNQLQMQAGVVGWNTIRVYNPSKQLADWDSECRFVKHWLPELKGAAPEQLIRGDHVPGYVRPVVPFKERARVMTDRLYAIRRSAEAKAATPDVFLRHASRQKPRTPNPGMTKTTSKSMSKSKPKSTNKSKSSTQTRSLFDDWDLESNDE
jgi:deoxyribodipyrimidine photo-lyase